MCESARVSQQGRISKGPVSDLPEETGVAGGQLVRKGPGTSENRMGSVGGEDPGEFSRQRIDWVVSSANVLCSHSLPGAGVGWRARFNGSAGLASPTPRFQASRPCSGPRAPEMGSRRASTDGCKRPPGRQARVPGSRSHQWRLFPLLCSPRSACRSACALSLPLPASALSLVAVRAGRRRGRWHGARELPALRPQGDS